MRRPTRGYVYILASRRNGTLYVGVTSDLVRRIPEHRGSEAPSFTAKYGVSRVVYFEVYEDILEAIAREKQLKKWSRRWKIALIERANPEWRDLYPQIEGFDRGPEDGSHGFPLRRD